MLRNPKLQPEQRLSRRRAHQDEQLGLDRLQLRLQPRATGKDFPRVRLAVQAALAAAGFEIVLGARRLDRLEAVAAELSGARALPLDVTDASSVESFCAQVPSCRVLVNNAGAPWASIRSPRPTRRSGGRRGRPRSSGRADDP